MDVSTFDHLVYVWEMSIGIVFLLSVGHKMRRPMSFVQTVASYRLLPRTFALPLGLMIILLEAGSAVGLITGWWSGAALFVALSLLLAYFAAAAINMRRGRVIECGCFGSTSEAISARSLVRLLALIGLSGVALAAEAAGSSPPGFGNRPHDVSAPAYLLTTVVTAGSILIFGSWLIGAREWIPLIPRRRETGHHAGL